MNYNLFITRCWVLIHLFASQILMLHKVVKVAKRRATIGTILHDFIFLNSKIFKKNKINICRNFIDFAFKIKLKWYKFVVQCCSKLINYIGTPCAPSPAPIRVWPPRSLVAPPPARRRRLHKKLCFNVDFWQQLFQNQSWIIVLKDRPNDSCKFQLKSKSKFWTRPWTTTTITITTIRSTPSPSRPSPRVD